MDQIQVDRQNLGLSGSGFLDTVHKWRLFDLVYVVVGVIVDYLLVIHLTPFERQFSVADPTISHPFAEHETVPVMTLLYAVVLGPLILIGLVSALLSPPGHKLYLFVTSYLGLAVGVITCDIFVTLLKNWIGRCRPDFLARCVPAKDAIYDLDVLYYAKDICTTDNIPMLLEGFRSTPSGHSSISFSCFAFCSFWLLAQFVALSSPLSGSWRFPVCCLPLVGAFFVAISRTEDYRHHFTDIVLGSVVGWLFAWWAYRRYFPSVFHNFSYVPIMILNEYANEEDGDGHEYKSQDFYVIHGLRGGYDLEGYPNESTALMGQ